MLLASPAPAAEWTGVVFVDADGDGLRDPDEAPRAGVRVSNGRSLQLTGEDGRYRFDAAPEGFVFVTCPDDFACAAWYRSAGGDFALVPRPSDDDFSFVQISDVHAYAEAADFARYSLADLPWWMPRSLSAFALSWAMPRAYDLPRGELLEGFRRALAPYRDVSELSGSAILSAYLDEFERPGSELGQVVPRIREALAEVAALRPAFVISTGDLVMEGNTAPPDVVEGWFALYRDLTGASGLELYQTIGNNEIAGSRLPEFPSDDPRYGKGTYRSFYGPTWYSFDRGPFHFAALDAHTRSGSSRSWELALLAPEVRAWLDADLSAHAGRVLVVLNHEPFHRLPGWTFYEPVDDAGLLARHGVAYALAGHIHQNGVERIGATLHVTSGALSGMRWVPPPDVHPRGYRLFRAQRGRLYSAWKELGRPLLGFVHPPGDPALFAAGEPPEPRDGGLELVLVAADVAGPFAALELSVDGAAVALEPWGDYFARARIAAGARAARLRARDAAGRVHEASLSLSPATGAP